MSRLEESTRLDLLSQSLLNDLKSEVEARIIKGMVEDFEKQARELVRKELENVTVEGISRALNVMKMREELELRINYGGGDVISRTV